VDEQHLHKNEAAEATTAEGIAIPVDEFKEILRFAPIVDLTKVADPKSLAEPIKSYIASKESDWGGR
jgi:hypothetical protein